jgi:predicted nucleotidyltransferase
MRHHDAALDAYVASVRDRGSTLAVIAVGSVARGIERPDSDVDVYLLVDDAEFDRALAENRLSWTERHDVDYPGGYLDVKLASPAYLAAAARGGDDPTRASFERARIAFSRLEGLERLIESVRSVPESEWGERVRSHVAQVRIHGGYFLEQASLRGDPFLVQHASAHLSLAAARAALARHRTLLQGPKYVSRALAALDLPAGFLERWSAVVESPDAASGARLVAAVDDWLGECLDDDETLSTFIRDNELAWLRGALPAEYR